MLGDHFNPLTLSILETAINNDWLKITEEIRLRLKEDKENLLKDEKLYSNLINWHETDHYIRHTSSELGLFYTFLLNYKLRRSGQLIFAKERETENYHNSHIELTEFIIDSLFDSGKNINQFQAVNSINQMFFLLFGVNNVFYTDNPESPSNPWEYTSYPQILEASAVSLEVNFLNQLKTDTSASSFSFDEAVSNNSEISNLVIENILNTKKRNHEFYFTLLHFLQRELRIPSACKMICSYAISPEVPFFTSEYIRPINWENFHPGYRLLKLTYTVKSVMESHDFLKEVNNVKLLNLDYTPIVQFCIWDIFEKISRKLFNEKTFYEKGQLDNDISEDFFINNLSQPFKSYLINHMFPQFQSILRHGFFSYNSFRKECAKIPLNYYCKMFVLSPFENTPPEFIVPDKYFDEKKVGDFYLTCSPLFTVRNHQFESIYFFSDKEETVGGVYLGIYSLVEYLIIYCISLDISKSDCISFIITYSSFSNIEENSFYQEEIKKRVEIYYSRLNKF